jgi:hypothetical protein
MIGICVYPVKKKGLDSIGEAQAPVGKAVMSLGYYAFG